MLEAPAWDRGRRHWLPEWRTSRKTRGSADREEVAASGACANKDGTSARASPASSMVAHCSRVVSASLEFSGARRWAVVGGVGTNGTEAKD